MSVVVARFMTEVEVVKLVGAATCYRLQMMQVNGFFVEQTRVAN